MKGKWAFAGACVQRAWKDSVVGGLYGPQIVFPLVAWPIVGFLIHQRFGSASEVADERDIWLIYGLAAPGAVFIAILAWNLLSAPYRIERDRRKKAQGELAAFNGIQSESAARRRDDIFAATAALRVELADEIMEYASGALVYAGTPNELGQRAREIRHKGKVLSEISRLGVLATVHNALFKAKAAHLYKPASGVQRPEQRELVAKYKQLAVTYAECLRMDLLGESEKSTAKLVEALKLQDTMFSDLPRWFEQVGISGTRDGTYVVTLTDPEHQREAELPREERASYKAKQNDAQQTQADRQDQDAGSRSEDG